MRWTRIIQSSLEFIFKGPAVLNSRSSPILQLGVLVVFPHVFSTDQGMPCCLCKTAYMLFPIPAKDPAFELVLNRFRLAKQGDILFCRSANAPKNLLANMLGLFLVSPGFGLA